ncbi:hypothetical protein C4900_09565 [Acidiferrobacter thiooxydans]|uniref:Uncharacterized protein n=1 Tax=Acidiferrobacter thiooxydans TaxID=163359 RepID=A0A1C2FYZ2_9GAMM|nr:hypothetical protein C4900_09565 [Acidiferrobacter thiooxydans]
MPPPMNWQIEGREGVPGVQRDKRGISLTEMEKRFPGPAGYPVLLGVITTGQGRAGVALPSHDQTQGRGLQSEP